MVELVRQAIAILRRSIYGLEMVIELEPGDVNLGSAS